MAVILFLLMILPAGAQEADTLSAARISSVKALPVLKPAEEIRLSSLAAVPPQVADLLRHFTGVQVKDYGGAGGLKTVNVRSLGSEHVGIFLDGIQIDNAQNMQVDLGRFSTDGLGSVTLYNGQKTKRLQTAKEYAAGAAVYLETAAPAGPGGRFRLDGGSLGTVRPSLQWDLPAGPVMVRLSGEGLYSDGRYSFPCFDTTLVRENGDIRSLRLEAQLFGVSAPSRGSWNLHLYHYGSERGFPGPVIRRAAGFPFSAERQADRNDFVQGGWSREWTVRYATSLRFKYADDYTHYDTHPEKNPMALPYNLHYRQRSGYLSLAHSVVLADPWSVDLATDLQRNALDSDAGQSVTPRRTTVTTALATRLVREKFRAAAHLVYLGAWDRFLSPEAGGWSRKDSYRDAWMPSISLCLKPFRGLEIESFLKRSWRLPSFNDLYYTVMGNAALDPESAVQWGIDLRWSGGEGPWTWEVRLSPYRNRVDDKIVAIPTLSQFRWTMLNIGRVDVTGLDSRAGAAFRKDGWEGTLTLRYAFQRALDHTTPGSATYGNQIPYIPRHSGAVDLTASRRDWTLSWSTALTGERWSRTANTPDYHLPPWSLTDLALRKTFSCAPFSAQRIRNRLSIGLLAGNIFNHRYEIVQGYPMPGTTVLLTLEYRW